MSAQIQTSIEAQDGTSPVVTRFGWSSVASGCAAGLIARRGCCVGPRRDFYRRVF